MKKKKNIRYWYIWPASDDLSQSIQSRTHMEFWLSSSGRHFIFYKLMRQVLANKGDSGDKANWFKKCQIARLLHEQRNAKTSEG